MTCSRTKRTVALLLFLPLAALVLLLLLAMPAGRPRTRGGKAPRIKTAKPVETEVEVQIEHSAPAVPPTPAAPQHPAPAETATDATGAFPPLWCSYREQVGFNRYADEMERRGAVFFLYSRARGGWHELDRKNSFLRPFDIGKIGTVFGGKPNSIEDEPALSRFLMNEDDPAEVFLAKPLAMEAAIQGAIRRGLQDRGIPLAEVIGIKAVYDYVGGRFCMVVSEVATRASGIRPLPMTITL